MQDDLFGKITWNDGTWVGAATFSQTANWGAAIYEADPPDARPSEMPDRTPTKAQLEAKAMLQSMAESMSSQERMLLEAAMKMAENMRNPPSSPSAPAERVTMDPEDAKRLREGICEVRIQNGRSTKPNAAHRAAWQAILDRGSVFWEELLKFSFETYLRQRPIRRRWWKEIYGNHLLDKRFPAVEKPQDMARLIRPTAFCIMRADKSASTAEMKLLVHATWDVDGFALILRDGKIAEAGQVVSIMMAPATPRIAVEHPVFGRIDRIQDDEVMEYINAWEKPDGAGKFGFENAKRVATRPWLGYTRFDAMCEYAMIIDEKTKYLRNREDADRPDSRMAWEFANGVFEVRIYTPPGEKPSEAQATAWHAFRKKEKTVAKQTIDGLFEDYVKTWRTLREAYKDRYVADVIPELSDADGLKHLIQLRCIHVHSHQASGVTIGLQFVTSYRYSGYTVFWRDGKIDRWGTWKDAEPKGMA